MRIRFIHPSIARLSFQPGDELVVSSLTDELKSLLLATRVDGARMVEVVRDVDDEIPEPMEATEFAIPQPTRGRRRVAV